MIFVFNLPNGQKVCNQPCKSRSVLGLVEMTWGLVHASYSLPEWQAVELTFFAPCLEERQKLGIHDQTHRTGLVEYSCISVNSKGSPINLATNFPSLIKAIVSISCPLGL